MAESAPHRALDAVLHGPSTHEIQSVLKETAHNGSGIRQIPLVNELRVTLAQQQQVHKHKGRNRRRAVILILGVLVVGGLAAAIAAVAIYHLRHRLTPKACKTSADCSGRSEVCVGAQKSAVGHCTAGNTCAVDADCPSGGPCLGGVCQPSGCSTAGDCVAANNTPTYCESASHACKVGCRADADCGGNALSKCSDAHVCVEPACRTNEDCVQGMPLLFTGNPQAAELTMCAVEDGKTVGYCTYPCIDGGCTQAQGLTCNKSTNACEVAPKSLPPITHCTSDADCASSPDDQKACIGAPQGVCGYVPPST